MLGPSSRSIKNCHVSNWKTFRLKYIHIIEDFQIFECERNGTKGMPGRMWRQCALKVWSYYNIQIYKKALPNTKPKFKHFGTNCSKRET